VLGSKHPDVAATLNNLGGFYNSQGKPVEAEHLLKRALAIQEYVWGPEHTAVATTLGHLGAIRSQ